MKNQYLLNQGSEVNRMKERRVWVPVEYQFYRIRLYWSVLEWILELV